MNKKIAFFLAFITGMAALVYQIYGFQVLFLFFVTSSKSAAISTSSSLFGIAIAAALFSRVVTHKNALKLLLLLNGFMFLYAQFVLKNYELIPAVITLVSEGIQTPSLNEAFRMFNFWLFLFVPAFCLGSILPILSALYVTSEKAFKDMGAVYFWDTLGAGIGALITGFVLIPLLGLSKTVDVAICLTLFTVLGLLIFMRVHLVWRVVFAVFVAGYVLHTAGVNKVMLQNLGYDEYLTEDQKINARFGDVVFRETSPFGLITVGKVLGIKTLFINYREMCTEDKGRNSVIASDVLSEETAHHIKGGTALNIGLGCGMTAAHLAKFADITHLDIAEINPVIHKVASTVFKKENHGVVHDPKVNVMITDGADYIKSTKKKYDAIVIDIEEVSVIYSSPLYTKEYFEIMRSKLNENGIVSIWSFEVSKEFQNTLYNTLKTVFPYVRLQYFDGSFNIYGSDKPIAFKYTPNQKLSEQTEQKVMGMKHLTHINTLDHRVLETLYNSNANFALPADYKEQFVK